MRESRVRICQAPKDPILAAKVAGRLMVLRLALILILAVRSSAPMKSAATTSAASVLSAAVR
jgi:hypothetical protein